MGGDDEVLKYIQALQDNSLFVRERATEALGELGDVRAVEPLIRALGDEYGNVCRGAIEALVKIGSAAIEPLIGALGDEDLDVRRLAEKTLIKMGGAAVEPLIGALEEDGHVRRGAAWALGEIGDERAVESLIGALSMRFDRLPITA